MLLLLCLLAIGHSSSATGPIVNAPAGRLVGFEAIARGGRTFQAWTKIPYAQPPVGHLRFRAPQPEKRWTGILNATEPMPDCVQNSRFPGGTYAGQEDCLYLNVFRPKINRKNLPTLVYVHGGAFQGGSASGISYAEFLMEEDVVLVAIQYRINGFGFMSLGDKTLPGNFGMKDQVMALKWVKNNIAAFGGDPDSVTVFGESAGAASTHLLLKSPATDNLVSRALSDSGSITSVWSMKRPQYIVNKTLEVAADLNCTAQDSEEILKCLQSVDVAALSASIGTKTTDPSLLPFAPVIEPVGAEQAFATKNLSLRPSKKPWIASITNGEYLLFYMMFNGLPAKQLDALTHNITQYLENWLSHYIDDPALLPSRVELLKNLYFSSKNESRTEQISKLHQGNSFYAPAVMNMLTHQGPKWLSHFEYPSGHYDVAMHASATHFLFNSSRLNTPADVSLSKRLIQRLVNFAYFDDPSPRGAPVKWDQFNTGEILRVTAEGDFMTDLSSIKDVFDDFYSWLTVLDWLK